MRLYSLRAVENRMLEPTLSTRTWLAVGCIVVFAPQTLVICLRVRMHCLICRRTNLHSVRSRVLDKCCNPQKPLLQSVVPLVRVGNGVAVAVVLGLVFARFAAAISMNYIDASHPYSFQFDGDGTPASLYLQVAWRTKRMSAFACDFFGFVRLTKRGCNT